MADEDFRDPRDIAADAIANGAAAKALAQLQNQLAAGRGGILTRIAVSQLAIAAGDPKLAAAVAQEAAQLAPDAVDVAIAFGEALAANADLTGAIAEFQRAARSDPDAAAPQLAIARLWAEAGEWEKALTTLERAEDRGANGAALRDQIDAAKRAPRLPAAFVRHLFDQFSADYDQRMLERLGYAAPAILRDMAAMYWGPKPRKRKILDLGCGTGLSGKAFADVAKPMTGVDLSPKMLAIARRTGAYSNLIEADIEDWLTTAPPNAFATVIAADVLVYLGDLNRVFAGVASTLEPGGDFLFSVEQAESGEFALGERRRYRHSEAYLRRLAADHGFDVASLIAVTLRFDAGQPVEGFAVLLVHP